MRIFAESVRRVNAVGWMIVAFIPLTALAQQAAPTEAVEDAVGEPVVITGSNIKRTDYEGPQSVIIFDTARIARTGATTVSDLLRRLPQNTAGFSEAVLTGNSFSPGAAAASLRGLGETATLVLVNGRRIAPFPLPQSGTDSFYDLNSIPIDAIERVEVLKEGASAVYGSDAIAGVINVILKDNYSGFVTDTYYGDTTSENASEFRQSFLSGFANEKFRLQVGGHYMHRNSLAAADRGFSRSADHRRMAGTDLRSFDSNPGTIFTSTDTLAVPRGSNGWSPGGAYLPGMRADGTFRNLFDFNRFAELLPETDRKGLFTTFGYHISPQVELFGEIFYQAVKTREMGAPTPVDSLTEPFFFVPATNPYNPFGEDVSFLWRAVEAGPRKIVTDLDSYRYLGGLRFKDLPHSWSLETTFLYSESNVASYLNGGFLGVSKVDRALTQTDASKALNVFGDGLRINRRDVIENLLIRPRTDGIAYLFSYDFKASGELFPLPAGPVSLAVGSEYREEALSHTNSFALGTIVSTGGSSSSGDRDVRSAYYELSIPITSKQWRVPGVEALEFSVAQRLDDYSDFGDVTKPKFGFKWKPLDGLLFRGAYSEGFRAPSLPQLFMGKVEGFVTVTNPRTNNTTDALFLIGGNPDLQPETSYSYFLGAIIEPPFIPGLAVGVDFYRIEQRNLIEQFSAQFIVDNLPAQVTFDENDNITSIDAQLRNLGKTVVDGFDVDVTYKLSTRVGEFSFESSLTFLNSFEQVLVPGRSNEEFADSFTLPEFKIVTSLFYRNEGFEIGATLNYIDSYDDERGNDRQVIRKVGSFTTVDLQASYEFNSTPEDATTSKDGKSALVPGTLPGWRRLLNNTKFTVGVINVGDVEPPFANIDEGYDTQTADPRGRFVYASVKKTFW